MSINETPELGSRVNTGQGREKNNQNIRVYVRIRPMNPRERTIRCDQLINVISPREVVTRHSPDSKITKKFTFDRVFGSQSLQSDVYNTVVSPMIEEVISGYNCTIFAYGQTGTGKTYTMVGENDTTLSSTWENDIHVGIIPRALNQLFEELRLLDVEFSMRISFLELYNEEIFDLLACDDNIKIRLYDDINKKGSIIIHGLEEIPVHTKNDVYKLLEKGQDRRRTAATLMNAQSSRSHTVFSIVVHIRENGFEGEEMVKVGKLNLVDLAGSENITKSGNDKTVRVREMANINQSLLTLGRVITALVERTPHIPYRESKLTRILQESLGGCTKTSIIATVSPVQRDIEESISTFEYAFRARNIQNKPEVNQKLTKRTVLKEYTEEIDKLKRDLEAAREKNGVYLTTDTYTEMNCKLDSQCKELNEKILMIKAMKDEMQNKEQMFNEVSLNLVEKTEELKRAEISLVSAKNGLMEAQNKIRKSEMEYQIKEEILLSQMATENALRNQATTILEVADIATKDADQLHSTIERRRDNDMKILNTCQQFSSRMRDNFENINTQLTVLRGNHDSCSNRILETLENSINIQDKLSSQTVDHLNSVNSRLLNFCTIVHEMTMKLSAETEHLSDDHKNAFNVFVNDFRINEAKMRAELNVKMDSMQDYSDRQRAVVGNLHETIARNLHFNAAKMQESVSVINTNLDKMLATVDGNAQVIAKTQEMMKSSDAIEVMELKAIEEFTERMKSLKNQKKNCTNISQQQLADLQTSHTQLKVDLQETRTHMGTIFECQRTHNADMATEVANMKGTFEKIAQVAANEYSSLRDDVAVNASYSLGQLENYTGIEMEHNAAMQQAMAMYAPQMNEVTEKMTAAIANDGAITMAGLNTENRHFAASMGETKTITNDMSKQLETSIGAFMDELQQSNRNLATFEKNELKTYTPTGSTPSKRTFSYPRVLATAEPHTEIIKRMRERTDWFMTERKSLANEKEEEADTSNVVGNTDDGDNMNSDGDITSIDHISSDEGSSVHQTKSSHSKILQCIENIENTQLIANKLVGDDRMDYYEDKKAMMS